MAFELKKEFPNGIVLDNAYAKVDSVYVSSSKKNATIIVETYKDKEARDSGKAPVDVMSYVCENLTVFTQGESGIPAIPGSYYIEQTELSTAELNAIDPSNIWVEIDGNVFKSAGNSPLDALFNLSQTLVDNPMYRFEFVQTNGGCIVSVMSFSSKVTVKYSFSFANKTKVVSEFSPRIPETPGTPDTSETIPNFDTYFGDETLKSNGVSLLNSAYKYLFETVDEFKTAKAL